MVEEGLAASRERAKALILSGVVLVNDTPVTKAGTTVAADAEVRLKAGAKDDWASRGAHKLLGALDGFGVDATGRICLDVGASTGGFTDVLLRRGASRVYAVDVGYGQLVWRLQRDERVVVLDRTNARHLTVEHIPEAVSLVVMDASFISVTLILPAVVPLVAPGADLLVMVKPQFEAGRGRVGKGGVVRDDAVRAETIAKVAEAAAGMGLTVLGTRDNDIRGPKGNLETFLHARAASAG